MTRRLNLSRFDPSRACLKFLEERIASDDYRGNQVSQHNRFNLNVTKEMLRQLNVLVGMNLMQIRDTDLSKRPENIEGEELYAEYVNRIANGSVGRGTQDSVRKNLFVDFHRMGFIHRFNKDRVPISPYQQSPIKYVSLSRLGLNLALTTNVFEAHTLYTRGIDNITHGLIDDILNIVLELDRITEDEYTFFASFLNCELNGKFYSSDAIVELVRDYRSLSRFTKDGIRNEVKRFCDPDLFTGSKINKRDFGNWVNETQQVFMLLSQTVFFELRDKVIYAKVGQNAMYEDNAKLQRSLSEKRKYFTFHNVQKKSGFELHHVIPLSWARNRNEFAVLDNHINLVYIDGYSHSMITQNSNNNVSLTFQNNDAIFSDFSQNQVVCEYHRNIEYDPNKKTNLLQFNNQTLASLE